LFSILFLSFSDLPFQCSGQKNHFPEFGRIAWPVNGIAPHQLRPGDAFQVRKNGILFVAILENHGMPWRNLSMRLFPYAKMHKFPYFLIAESAQDSIGNLPSQVAVGIRLDGSDWKPVA